MAFLTAARASVLTRGDPVSTRETVVLETPAAAATAHTVGRLPGAEFLSSAINLLLLGASSHEFDARRATRSRPEAPLVGAATSAVSGNSTNASWCRFCRWPTVLTSPARRAARRRHDREIPRRHPQKRFCDGGGAPVITSFRA